MNSIKVILLLVELTTVFSLECWDCKSSINAACSDPFLEEPFAKMNCSASPKYEMLKQLYGNKTTQLCRKITEKIDGEMRVIRTCGYLEEPSPEEGKCVTRVGSSGLQIISCHCFTDACNTGTNIHPTSTAITILLTSTILFISTLILTFS